MSTSINCDTTIGVSLRLTSLIATTERMVEVLPFTPTDKWAIGDTIGKSSIRRECNGVVLTLPCENGEHLETVVLKLLDFLEPVKQAFVHAVANELMECELSCVAFFSNPPSCNFTTQTIVRIADLKLSLDIDLILLTEPQTGSEEERVPGTNGTS